MDMLESGDILIVTKPDCRALEGTGLTCSVGARIIAVLNAVTQLERGALTERTQSCLKRAKSGGKILGRPSMLGRAVLDTLPVRLESLLVRIGQKPPRQAGVRL